jgi:hypothetical protein
MKTIPEIGQTFPSYRGICRFLDEPVLAGNSKEAQLKKWRQGFTWIREGNKWIVVEHQDAIEHYTKSRSSRWAKYIEPQILLMLYAAFHDFGHPVHTKTTLPIQGILLFSLEALYQLGFCNDKYFDLRDGKLEGFSESQQQDYYNISFPRIYTTMTNALNRLSAAAVIGYYKEWLITVGKETRLATREERNDIDALKRVLLKRYNKSEQAIMRSQLRIEFFENLALLIEVNLGFSKAYRVHHLLFTEDSIAELPYVSKVMAKRKELNKSLNEESLLFHLKLLNDPPFQQITNLIIPIED